jgi:hypothetical protein
MSSRWRPYCSASPSLCAESSDSPTRFGCVRRAVVVWSLCRGTSAIDARLALHCFDSVACTRGCVPDVAVGNGRDRFAGAEVQERTRCPVRGARARDGDAGGQGAPVELHIPVQLFVCVRVWACVLWACNSSLGCCLYSRDSATGRAGRQTLQPPVQPSLDSLGERLERQRLWCWWRRRRRRRHCSNRGLHAAVVAQRHRQSITQGPAPRRACLT